MALAWDLGGLSRSGKVSWSRITKEIHEVGWQPDLATTLISLSQEKARL
jgi:hypothetical protein